MEAAGIAHGMRSGDSNVLHTLISHSVISPKIFPIDSTISGILNALWP
jgi:hypothetical protein